MPFRDGVFDAVVYDPPHVPDQGQDRRRDFRSRFGLGDFSPGFLPFMQEARRVLRPGGVLFCKVADYVHVHRQHWAHVEVCSQRGGWAVALRLHREGPAGSGG